jgi:predicted nucleic acid-binding protein
VFVDADVLFAGAAGPSQHGASLVVLRLAEITLIEAITSQQVVTEAERNLEQKLPQALPAFRLILNRCLRVVPDPQPSELAPLADLADAKDLPMLAAAVREGCPWLVTFNLRHFQPGHPDVTVLRPGDCVLRVRGLLAWMTQEPEE